MTLPAGSSGGDGQTEKKRDGAVRAALNEGQRAQKGGRSPWLRMIKVPSDEGFLDLDRVNVLNPSSYLFTDVASILTFVFSMNQSQSRSSC